MHGLQAWLFKYITVAAFRIYLSMAKMPLKGEVGGHALKSHGNYIVDHGKSWKNHGIVFLNFCGNLDLFFNRLVVGPRGPQFLNAGLNHGIELKIITPNQTMFQCILNKKRKFTPDVLLPICEKYI